MHEVVGQVLCRCLVGEIPGRKEAWDVGFVRGMRPGRD